MADPLPPAQRSERMRKVKRENTAPELIVRRLAHSLGFRFRNKIWMRDFFKAHSLEVGDQLVFSRTGPRSFRLEVRKAPS